MLTFVLILLTSWFIISIPVGLLVGRMLAHCSRELAIPEAVLIEA